ncbi:hypothetical protein KSP39_PZI004996 [Platanthera zijinensis]|uniref:Uncharacterized protein n=1 Tax=Platanthera zijinensis TaxID=2320716 RepID=A0AAP0BRN3_9ASPA
MEGEGFGRLDRAAATCWCVQDGFAAGEVFHSQGIEILGKEKPPASVSPDLFGHAAGADSSGSPSCRRQGSPPPSSPSALLGADSKVACISSPPAPLPQPPTLSPPAAAAARSLLQPSRRLVPAGIPHLARCRRLPADPAGRRLLSAPAATGDSSSRAVDFLPAAFLQPASHRPPPTALPC